MKFYPVVLWHACDMTHEWTHSLLQCDRSHLKIFSRMPGKYQLQKENCSKNENHRAMSLASYPVCSGGSVQPTLDDPNDETLMKHFFSMHWGNNTTRNGDCRTINEEHLHSAESLTKQGGNASCFQASDVAVEKNEALYLRTMSLRFFVFS